MTDTAATIESVGKAVSTASATPIDDLIQSFSGFFGAFAEKNPCLTALVFIFLCCSVVCVLLIPVWVYISKQKTIRHKNILEYKSKVAETKLKAMQSKIRQVGNVGAEK